MNNQIGKYRKLLDQQHQNASKLLLDEIEHEVVRLRNFTDEFQIDSNDPGEVEEFVGYVKESLKSLAEKLY